MFISIISFLVYSNENCLLTYFSKRYPNSSTLLKTKNFSNEFSDAIISFSNLNPNTILSHFKQRLNKLNVNDQEDVKIFLNELDYFFFSLTNYCTLNLNFDPAVLHDFFNLLFNLLSNSSLLDAPNTQFNSKLYYIHKRFFSLYLKYFIKINQFLKIGELINLKFSSLKLLQKSRIRSYITHSQDDNSIFLSIIENKLFEINQSNQKTIISLINELKTLNDISDYKQNIFYIFYMQSLLELHTILKNHSEASYFTDHKEFFDQKLRNVREFFIKRYYTVSGTSKIQAARFLSTIDSLDEKIKSIESKTRFSIKNELLFVREVLDTVRRAGFHSCEVTLTSKIPGITIKVSNKN